MFVRKRKYPASQPSYFLSSFFILRLTDSIFYIIHNKSILIGHKLSGRTRRKRSAIKKTKKRALISFSVDIRNSQISLEYYYSVNAMLLNCIWEIAFNYICERRRKKNQEEQIVLFQLNLYSIDSILTQWII